MIRIVIVKKNVKRRRRDKGRCTYGFESHRDGSCFYFADKVNVAEEGRVKQVLVTGY